MAWRGVAQHDMEWHGSLRRDIPTGRLACDICLVCLPQRLCYLPCVALPHRALL